MLEKIVSGQVADNPHLPLVSVSPIPFLSRACLMHNIWQSDMLYKSGNFLSSLRFLRPAKGTKSNGKKCH